jgi:hypothetical protein
MPAMVTCPNPKCRTAIPADGKQVGESVTCPKCGAEARVFADFGTEFDISTIKAPQEGQAPLHHPARLKCTACGAVLGVRDAVCPSCGGDVRTGMTHLRITEGEKAAKGVGRRRRPTVKSRGVVPAGALPKKGPSPLVVVLGLLLLLVLAAAGVVGYLVMTTGG